VRLKLGQNPEMAFNEATKAAKTFVNYEFRTNPTNITTQITNKPAQISRISTSS
jgi:hypothetical protein